MEVSQVGKEKDNLPQCAKYLNDFGNAFTNSSSIKPVILTDPNVRYATTTPSSFPLWHSLMKSSRFLDSGFTNSATSARLSQAACALVNSTREGTGHVVSYHKQLLCEGYIYRFRREFVLSNRVFSGRCSKSEQ